MQRAITRQVHARPTRGYSLTVYVPASHRGLWDAIEEAAIEARVPTSRFVLDLLHERLIATGIGLDVVGLEPPADSVAATGPLLTVLQRRRQVAAHVAEQP